MSKTKTNKSTVASKEATILKEKVVETAIPVAKEISDSTEETAAIEEVKEANSTDVEANDSTEEKATTKEVDVIKKGVNPLSNNRKKANQLFELYPDATEIHFAQDGKAFFEENNAIGHASALTVRFIETIKRK